jgi:hypothetical protein
MFEDDDDDDGPDGAGAGDGHGRCGALAAAWSLQPAGPTW